MLKKDALRIIEVVLNRAKSVPGSIVLKPTICTTVRVQEWVGSWGATVENVGDLGLGTSNIVATRENCSSFNLKISQITCYR